MYHSAYLNFYLPVPFSEETARVVITCSKEDECREEELLSVDVPKDPPKVRIISPKKCDELSGKVKVKWEGYFDNKCLYYILRYSNSEGKSWRNISPRIQTTEYMVDLDLLPAGERCQFQVLATEGIRTGVATSEPFRVTRHPRITKIISPDTATTVMLGDTVTLSGEAFSPDMLTFG